MPENAYPTEAEAVEFFLRELWGLSRPSPDAMWGREEVGWGWMTRSDASSFDPWHNADDALEIIRRMHLRGYRYEVRGFFEGMLCHHAAFDADDCADSNPLYQELGATFEEAISRAAYKALQSDVSPAGTWWTQAGQGDPWKLLRDPSSQARPLDAPEEES